MVILPPQSQPVCRDPHGHSSGEAGDGDGVAALQGLGGVQSSQTRCDHLTGPAQSMCYAALYGIRV